MDEESISKFPGGGVVLASQAEGLYSLAAGRVFGYQEETIPTWVTRRGEHAVWVHRHFFHYLPLDHVELDELRTILRDKAHELWVVLDACSKVIPCGVWAGGRKRWHAW